MDNTNPLVSIVVPCRNERDYIEVCIRSILAQERPPGGFEVIVSDGMSDDGTREILKRITEEDPRVQVIDNPGQTAPCGRNVGILKARGRYIAILDAHTEYAADYVRKCTEILSEHPEVCCAGGPIVSKGKSIFGRAIAAAMSHPLGVGNAKHRFPDYEGYAEGACFPMFRREIFDKFGLFDETLVRNQDDEFNNRVTRGGEKIFLSPGARCVYFVRERPLQLFWQYFQYGYWRVAVLRKQRFPASLRQLVPVGFFLLMFGLLVVGLCLPGRFRFVSGILPVGYLFMLIAAGMKITRDQGILVGVRFPIAAAILHAGYAAGFIWSVVTGRMEKVNKHVFFHMSSTRGGAHEL
jgi:glycosyltransferase involved in cell wall biosynthesis